MGLNPYWLDLTQLNSLTGYSCAVLLSLNPYWLDLTPKRSNFGNIERCLNPYWLDLTRLYRSSNRFRRIKSKSILVRFNEDRARQYPFPIVSLNPYWLDLTSLEATEKPFTV